MNKKREVVLNFIWQFAERCGAQLVSFIVSIVLARLLLPEDYGLVALMLIFINVLQVFVDSGLGNALIQKKDADELDFSTVFYVNIVLSLVLYILVYCCSPFIASYFENVQLCKVLRCLGLAIVIAGIKNIQHAYVAKNMLFKKFFFATLGGTLISAVIGIFMAVNDFGIWALVMQYISNLAIDTIILWCTVKWRPCRKFSFRRLSGLLSYGWKLLISRLIDTVYNNVWQLVIGKSYSTIDLAYFNRGQQFPQVMATNINSSIDSVLFPVMSYEQKNKMNIKRITQQSIETSSYIMWPMMIGLIVIAEPLVRLILTEQWIECVPFMRIFCINYALYPIHTANLNAIKAMGRSDYYLILEIIKKTIGICAVVVTMGHGVSIMAYSILFTTVISSFLNAYPNKDLLDYKYLEQIKDIGPIIVISIIMGLLIYPISFLELSDAVIVLFQVLLGVFIYIILSKLFKIKSYSYIINIMKDYL